MIRRQVTNEVQRRAVAMHISQLPPPFSVAIGEPIRSLDQNAKLWPMLQDVSRQVNWYGERLTADEWKDVFTAALKKQKVVPGIDGGFVVCGTSTSKMPKSQFSELIELIYAFGAERGVQWSEIEAKPQPKQIPRGVTIEGEVTA